MWNVDDGSGGFRHSVAAHVRVPKSEVWGVASHYPEFRLERPAARIVRICTGLACAARGGNELLAHALRRAPSDVTLEPMDWDDPSNDDDEQELLHVADVTPCGLRTVGSPA